MNDDPTIRVEIHNRDHKERKNDNHHSYTSFPFRNLVPNPPYVPVTVESIILGTTIPLSSMFDPNEGGLERKNRELLLEKQTYDGKEECSCSICMDAIVPNSMMYKLSCGHTFHTLCLNNWGKYKPTCPVCRCKIPFKNKHSFEDQTL